MGCFNSNCFVSHVPVAYGDNAVIIYLGATTSAQMLEWGIKYLPIFLPVKGKYNDYGDLEEIDETSISYKTMKKIIYNRFPEVAPASVRGGEDCFDVFMDNIHLGRQILPNEWSYFSSKAIFNVRHIN